jgi:TonB family protein
MKKPLISSGLALMAFFCFAISSSQTAAQPANDQPAVTAAVAPNYPPIARSAHISGDVIVEVKINSLGDVENTKVLSGHPLLQAVSKEVAKKWKFVPSTEKHSRIAQLTFAFSRVESGKSVPQFTTTFLPPYRVEVVWNSNAYQ